MPSAEFAAYVLFALLGVLALFQLALALGAPLGRYAMGGMVEGVYPPPMRIAALVQIAIYAVIGAIVFARLGGRFRISPTPHASRCGSSSACSHSAR